MLIHKGCCHCSAISLELHTPRLPAEQTLGACQCAFCRKHNARAFSDPASLLIIHADVPDCVQHYSFGLETSHQILCRRCGVYIAMIMKDSEKIYSVLNIDTLDAREEFTQLPIPKDFSRETAPERIARRKAAWIPTTLNNWPEV